jgi:hypothetical protein
MYGLIDELKAERNDDFANDWGMPVGAGCAKSGAKSFNVIRTDASLMESCAKD